MIRLGLRRAGEGEARARRSWSGVASRLRLGGERNVNVGGTRGHHGRAKETGAPVGKRLKKKATQRLQPGVVSLVKVGECAARGSFAVRKCVLQKRAGIVVVTPVRGHAKMLEATCALPVLDT